MKRLHLEDAERMEIKHLSYRRKIRKNYKSSSNQIQFGWTYRYHGVQHTWNRVTRFITSWVDKPYKECFSKFLKTIREDRVFKKFQSEFISDFRDAFNSTHYGKFFVTKDGLIKERPQAKARTTILHKKLVKRIPPYFPPSIKHLTVGTVLSYSDYSDYYIRLPFLVWERFKDLFENYYLPKPKMGKKEGKILFKKKRSLSRKARKSNKSHPSYDTDLRLHSHCNTIPNKVMRKKAQREQERIEREKNIITRDRLGFDETSFTEAQPFNRK